MTDKKKYNKLTRAHKKNFKKLAKKAHPFDFSFLLCLIREQLEYMRDYYSLGYNVWSRELNDETATEKMKKLYPYTRLEGIQKALDELDAYDNCENKYFIYHETGGIKNGKGNRFIVVDKKGKEKEIIDDSWIEELIPDPVENKDAFIKENEEHWNNFFTILKEHMGEWWD